VNSDIFIRQPANVQNKVYHRYTKWERILGDRHDVTKCSLAVFVNRVTDEHAQLFCLQIRPRINKTTPKLGIVDLFIDKNLKETSLHVNAKIFGPKHAEYIGLTEK
jgi:hypothetical protein